MDAQPKTRRVRTMEMINKNTSVSIGLGVSLFAMIFWVGLTLGKVQAKQTEQGRLIDTFVPRIEQNVRWDNIENQLTEIKDTQRQILDKIEKK